MGDDSRSDAAFASRWYAPVRLANLCCSFWTILLIVAILGVALFEAKRPFTPWMLFISIIPAFAVMVAFYWYEHQRHLDFFTVTAMYAAGIVGAIPVSVCELIISRVVLNMPDQDEMASPQRSLAIRLFLAFLASFLVASLVEEVFKFVTTFATVQLRRLTSAYGIVVIALSVSMGFASLENLGYLVNVPSATPDSEVIAIGIARGCMSVPLHASTGALIGVGLSKSVHGEDWPMWRILWIPFLVHGLYDFVLMGSEATLVPAIAAAGVGFAFLIVLSVGAYAYSQGRAVLQRSEREHWEDRDDGEYNAC